MRKRLLRTTTFGVIFTIFVLVWIFVVGISAGQKGSFYNKGHNAVWMTSLIGEDDEFEMEIQRLIDEFRNYQIDLIFVDVGMLKKDGTIDPVSYKDVVEFLEKAKQYHPEISYQAWIGQSESGIDLKNDEVRANIAKQVMIFGQLIGFDGVHLRFSDDVSKDYLLKLLKESRLILPENKKLSVYTEHFTASDFYIDAMKYADQFVVAGYGSKINSQWWYKWRVREQVTRLTKLLIGKEVFVAVSADQENEVENFKNTLEGVISGLNNFRSKQENFSGIALDDYWAIDQYHVKTYEKLWLE